MKQKIKPYTIFALVQMLSCAFAQQMSETTLLLNNYLPSSTVLRVHCDRKGFLWLGTKDGLCRYDGYRVLVFRSGLKNPDLLTNNELITCITENRNRYLFIGTKKGINILNKSTYQITPVKHSELKDQEIRTMIVDSDGWIWIGTLTSVFRCSADFSFCKRYDSALPITSVNIYIYIYIYIIYEDADKNIWMTLWERGLHRYDSKKDTFVAMHQIGTLNNPFRVFQDDKKQHWILAWESGIFLFYPEEKQELMYRHVNIKSDGRWDESGCFSITQDDKYGYIWIVSTQGLYALQKRPDDVVDNVDISYVSSIKNIFSEIVKDKSGNLWIAAFNEGVSMIDLNKPLIQNYSFPSIREKTGFVTNIKNIYNIITDQLGHIWISTNKRVIEYDSKNGGIMDYSTMDDVMENSFMPNSYFKTRSEKILYGGNKGISVFTPYEHLSDNPRRIRTMVTDVKIDGVSSLLEKDNQRFNLRSQTISFDAGDKNIEIDFSPLNYAFPNKIKYAYKMEGVDDDWVYVRGDRQYAFYNQLPKGKRTFYLKTIDTNGLWSNYIAEIQVSKNLHFMKLGGLIAVLVILSLYLLHRRMKRHLQLRHELRIAQINQEKSEELVQTKLRYFTNISHDLMIPLTTIICLIDDAEMTNGSRISQLSMIRSNVNKLRRLLQQILDFRKVESGNMKLSVSKSDIISFIDDVCKVNFAPLIKKKGQIFTFSTEDKHLIAYFDRDKVDEIVSNLLSNACKYTSEGGEIKLIMSSYQKMEHVHLRIQVVDTGEGVASGDLENILKRFYTANKGGENESNGIGLSLTKELVELHHGTIDVESELAKGSTFTVDFPIDKDSYQENELVTGDISADDKKAAMIFEREDLDEPKKVEDEQITDNHLLLVEDNEELLYLMEKILSRQYHVLIAKNGLEALNVIKDNDIDIIISDVMMPEMDGLELCRNLKSNLETSHIPIILLTVKNMAEDRIDCYNAGADGYMSKPFELKILEARINNFMIHKKSKQEEFRANVEVDVDSLPTSSIDKKFLNTAVSIIESNMAKEDFDVAQLAYALIVSKSSLYRKIKVATGLSPIEFIRSIRLKHASQLLKNKSMSIAEVAYKCGFSNPKYFTTCFKRDFGVTPKKYRKSY